MNKYFPLDLGGLLVDKLFKKNSKKKKEALKISTNLSQISKFKNARNIQNEYDTLKINELFH